MAAKKKKSIQTKKKVASKGTAARVTWNSPRTLTENTRSHSSSDRVSRSLGFQAAVVPALLISTSRRWNSFSTSYFYSDSLNDLPLLHKVTEPVAVDPDETLKECALEKGWMIISLR